VAPGTRAAMAGPAPGDVLRNRFVLHQCLADGSTSRLFRALDRRLEESGDPDPWVVLKVVTATPGPEGGAPEARAVQALRREAALARGLDHPNLPRIIGIDHDGPHTFVCMAWIEGESLAAILDSRGARPMTRVQALHILEGVGRALCHLHAQGITHADVKPGNILVTPQGDATLLDFGVAVGPGADDLPAVRGFTPEYASPEVLAGSAPTPPDDLFSLACVAYRMLGGHRAFGTLTAREAAASGSRPGRPTHLSPAQWRALDRALAFDRAARQPDVATFLVQLKGTRDETQASTDLEPDTSGADAPAGSAAGGVRALLPGTALVLALAVAGVIGWRLLPSGAPVPAARVAPRAPAAPEAVPLPPPVALPAPPPVATPAPTAEPAPASTPQPRASPAPAPPRSPPPPPAVEPAPRELEPEPPAPAATRGPPRELAGPPRPDPVADPPVPPAALPADAPRPDTTVPFSTLTVRRYVEPDYPRSAAARGLAGWVEVGFTVEPSGRTRDVRVLGAEPPGVFNEAALTAVRRWRFAGLPARDTAGGAVRSVIRLRFEPAEPGGT